MATEEYNGYESLKIKPLIHSASGISMQTRPEDDDEYPSLSSSESSSELLSRSPSSSPNNDTLKSNLSVAVHSWFGPNVGPELALLFKLTWPVSLANFARLVMSITDTSVLGHLGTEYLAASSLAWVWMDLSGTLSWAPLDALSTLCSQAFGAKNYPLVGVWFQVGVIFTILTTIPLAFTWLCTDQFLQLIGIDARLAGLAQQFATYSILWLLPDSLNYAICLYFQAQEVVYPMLVINVVFVFVNLLANIVLVNGLHITLWSTTLVSWGGLGYIGSPLATAITRILNLVVMIGYMFYWKKLHAKTWPAHSWNFRHTLTKERFVEYIKLSIPTVVSTAVENWQLEVVTFFSSRLGIIEIATQTGLFNIFYTLHCLAYGLSQASNVRVAYHLGANDVEGAKGSANIASAVTAVLGVVIGSSLYIFRNSLVQIYSDDPEVWELNNKVAWTNAVAFFSVAMLLTLTSILRAQGRPTIVAILGNICSWGISVPLAYYCAFSLNMGIMGLWVGLLTAYTTYFFGSAVLVYFSTWDNYAEQAQNRSEADVLHSEPLLPKVSEEEESEELFEES